MQTVVICGANRGIGLALAREFTSAGSRVIALCREASKDLRDLGATSLDGVDVTSGTSLASIEQRLRGAGVTRIDTLINNAGILDRQTIDDLDDKALDSMRRQFEVNALGPLRVTAAVRGLLGDNSKVAIITSRMGSLADNTSGGQYGYRMSKAAVNMAGRSLAHDLASDGVAVALIHPGYVRTDMTGGRGLIDPPEAAAGIAAVIGKLDQDNTGKFWHSNTSELPW